MARSAFVLASANGRARVCATPRYAVVTVDEKTGKAELLSDRRLSLAAAAAVCETFNSLRHGDPHIAVAVAE